MDVFRSPRTDRSSELISFADLVKFMNHSNEDDFSRLFLKGLDSNFHMYERDTNESNINSNLSNHDFKSLFPMFNFPLSEAYNIFQETKQGSYLHPKAQIVILVVYIVMIVLGTVANTIVALVICRHQEIRTARNLYVINLTISDITLCLICMPFTLVGLMERHWKLGNFICKLVPVLQCTNILVSTATIVAIAADRYLVIVRIGRRPRPKHYNRISVAAIWIISLLFPLPLFKSYYLKPVTVQNILLYESCVEDWSSRTVQMAWTITLIVLQYIIPILVLTFVHIRIKNFLSKHKMNRLCAVKKSQELDRNRKTTLLLTTIAITFAVSWAPWHVVNMLADFDYFAGPEYFYALFAGCHLLAMSTVCSNTVLYGWLNTNLRKELIQNLQFIKRSLNCCRNKHGRNRANMEGDSRKLKNSHRSQDCRRLSLQDPGSKNNGELTKPGYLVISPNSPTRISTIAVTPQEHSAADLGSYDASYKKISSSGPQDATSTYEERCYLKEANSLKASCSKDLN